MNRFASRARNIKTKPELNEVMSDGVLLKRYAKQIDKLHTELEVSLYYYKCQNIFYGLDGRWIIIEDLLIFFNKF